MKCSKPLYLLSALFGLTQSVACLADACDSSRAMPNYRTINAVQGRADRSSLAGATVRLCGVVTGVTGQGFFIQSIGVDDDRDLATSDGMYIYSRTPPPAAIPGNVMHVVGTVSEYAGPTDSATHLVIYYGPPETEVTTTATPYMVGTAPVAVVPLATPDPAGSITQLERYEGMRVSIPEVRVVQSTSASINPLTGMPNNLSGSFYAVFAGVADPHREAGLLAGTEIEATVRATRPSVTDLPRYDGNPEAFRVVTGPSYGLSSSPMRLDFRVGQTLSNVTGIVHMDAGEYSLLLDHADVGAMPGEAAPIRLPREDKNSKIYSRELTIATMNLENFSDDVDDPTGEEIVRGSALYQDRLDKTANTILNGLHGPDIIVMQEIENAAVARTISDRVFMLSGKSLHYSVVFRGHGLDSSGAPILDRYRQHIAMLVKDGTVQFNDATDVDLIGADATYSLPDGTTPLIFDRPPLRLRAKLQPGYMDGTASPWFDPLPITVVGVHMKAFINSDRNNATGEAVRIKRKAGAEYLAKALWNDHMIIGAERFYRPMVVAGDFNALDVTDGLYDVVGAIRLQAGPSWQPVSPEISPTAPPGSPADSGMAAWAGYLTDIASKTNQYSYIHAGSRQLLDHVLTDHVLNYCTDLDSQAYHISTTYPAATRVSDHDPLVLYIKQFERGRGCDFPYLLSF